MIDMGSNNPTDAGMDNLTIDGGSLYYDCRDRNLRGRGLDVLFATAESKTCMYPARLYRLQAETLTALRITSSARILALRQCKLPIPQPGPLV